MLVIFIMKVDYIKKIETYAETHAEITMGEVFNFKWDVAYNELNYYGRGEEVKRMSGYEFEVEQIGVDHMQRFLFFKKGKLVKEVLYEFRVFEFPSEILKFEPDTVFVAHWKDVVNNGATYKHLVLTRKE